MESLNIEEIISYKQPLGKVTQNEDETCVDFSNLNLETVTLKAYISLKNVTRLDLSDNKLSSLDGDIFLDFQQLVWFDVRYNSLTTLPSTIKHHPSLETILLGYNRIETLPIELGSLPKLKAVQIRGNPIINPGQDIIFGGLSSIINFLRSEWRKEKKLEEGSEKEPMNQGDSETVHKKPKKRIKTHRRSSSLSNVNKYIVRDGTNVYVNMLDHIWNIKLRNLLESREKELQKVRDKQELKRWREKYFQNSAFESIQNVVLSDPPFATDPRMRMMTRKELLEPILERPEIVTRRKSYEDVDIELRDIVRRLNSIQTSDNTDITVGELSQRQDDINKLKAIQKMIGLLKIKT